MQSVAIMRGMAANTGINWRAAPHWGQGCNLWSAGSRPSLLFHTMGEWLGELFACFFTEHGRKLFFVQKIPELGNGGIDVLVGHQLQHGDLAEVRERQLH